MENPVANIQSYSVVRLAPGDVLITQGEPGGNLYVLEEGELAVERDGVPIATISRPFSVVGEMSVVLGTPTSATVRAKDICRVRVFADARSTMSHDAEFAFHLAYLIASRLNATSALLVEHTKKHGGKGEDIVQRVLNALHLPTEPAKYAEVHREDMFGSTSRLFGD